MLNTSSCDTGAPDQDERQARPEHRLFGRLRSPLEGADLRIADAQIPAQQGDGEVALPIDSAKTFIGPNGTYYDDYWRWMDWRGRSRSWNWAAALSFGGWLAYRRLYRLAALHLAWLGLLLALALNGVPLLLVAILLGAGAVALGSYGNALYFRKFRQAAVQAAQRQTEHRARLDALAKAGGTSRGAVLAMVAAGVALAVLVVGLTRALTGGIELYL